MSKFKTVLTNRLRASSLNKLRVKLYNYVLFSKLVTTRNLLKVVFTNEPEVTVPLKKGVALTLRTHDVIDISVAGYVFVKGYHLPPFSLPGNAVIIDLGSNIGCTIMDYAMQYPDATIFGIEMDRDNFIISTKNIAPFNNATVSNYAVWSEDSTVRYSKNLNSESYSVAQADDQQRSKDVIEVQSIRIATFLAKNSIYKVDFMKIDIEGAEYEIFCNSDSSWLKSVEAVHVEIHNKDWIIPISETLRKHDFTIIPDEKHWSALFARSGRKATSEY